MGADYVPWGCDLAPVQQPSGQADAAYLRGPSENFQNPQSEPTYSTSANPTTR